MTAPQQGGGYAFTRPDLTVAQDEFELAAQRVAKEFKDIEDAVQRNPSKGDAFIAAQQVAAALRTQSDKLGNLTRELAEKVGASLTSYMRTNEAGSEEIGKVAGMAGEGGATFGRLVPDGRA